MPWPRRSIVLCRYGPHPHGCVICVNWSAQISGQFSSAIGAVRPHISINGITPEAFAKNADKAYNNSQTLTQN
ncbi:hypothetical protein F3J08_15955 [Asaia sp. As-1742]|nr:hypothetical protein [Asaia sp. As-1742]